jgi:hypothetical protein
VVKFNSGRYTFFHSVSDIDGALVPGQEALDAGVIQLGTNPVSGGDTMIANPGGLNRAKVVVYSGANVLRGQPLFFGSNDLVFNDDSAYLRIAIQNTLNTNILLNGAQFQLQDDLRMGGSSVIVGDGIVDFNFRRLSLGGANSVWDGNLLFAVPDLQFNGAVVLNGIWFFYGETGNQLNGNGTVIDLSGGGVLWILEGSDIAFSSVYIKGLGDGEGTIIVDPGATLHFSDVTLEMDSDYVVRSGTWQIDGPTTVITRDHILQFADSDDGSTSGKLIVNNTSLNYNTGVKEDNFNIRPRLSEDLDHKYVEEIGSGLIAALYFNPISSFNYLNGNAANRVQPTRAVTTKTPTTKAVTRYVMVGPDRPLPINPVLDDQGHITYDVTIDGNSYFMGFTRTDQKVLIVTANVQATTQNIIMRELSPDHIQLEDGATLTFGDQTNIVLAKNEKLTYPWYCTGNVLLRGSGAILDLSNGGALVVKGANSTLMLDSVIITGVTGNNIRCLDASSKIIFKNVKLIFSGDATYDTGGIDIMDDVTMVGPNALTYRSDQPFRILANSTLYWLRGFGFMYAPISGSSNLFNLLDYTSILWLDEATFVAEGAGVTLTTGQFYLRDQNYQSGKIILDPSLTVDAPGGATFESI